MIHPTVLKFCPRCGSPEFAAKAAHHHVCAACAFEWFINPAVAAACFVFDDRNQVLLIRRQKDPGKGLLAPPGGFLDSGETAEAGVRREVREETGLDLEAVTYLCSQPNTYSYGGYNYNVLDIFFVARVPAFSGLVLGDDVSGLVVLPAAEIAAADLAFPSMQAAWHFHRSGPG
jgi:ADP-ribose pyrophosphatase YjhB (NUDIX family)